MYFMGFGSRYSQVMSRRRHTPQRGLSPSHLTFLLRQVSQALLVTKESRATVSDLVRLYLGSVLRQVTRRALTYNIVVTDASPDIAHALHHRLLACELSSQPSPYRR